IFVIGGQDAGSTVLATVEEYLAQALTLAAIPHTSLPAPRAQFGIGSTLTTNQIYVMGGFDNTGADQGTIFADTTAHQRPTPGRAGERRGTGVHRGSLSIPRRGLRGPPPPAVPNFLPPPTRTRAPRRDSTAVWTQRKVRSARAPGPPPAPAAMAGRTLFGQVGL